MNTPVKPFGPYELIRPLGVGGMAETFVANRRGPGGFEQRVCLKRVLPAFNRDPRFINQFLQEARLAASLRHGNIVGVIDFGEHEGTYYMALELVEGCDLRKLVTHQPDNQLPMDLAVQVAIDLAYALDYAHNAEVSEDTHGIVHRDLSPGNVLLSRSGGVRLADFGIAKAMRGMAATASGVVKGKIPYMAPEQMRGEALDGRVDLFSLGVIIWEILVGMRPFDGANDVDTMSRIVSGERPALQSLMPALHPRLIEIIERLIQTDKENRFESAETLVDALAEVGGSPASKKGLGKLVSAINPKPDRTTGPTPARPSGPVAPQAGAARTTPFEGLAAGGSQSWDQTTQTTPEDSSPHHAPPQAAQIQSGSFDHWSSPGNTGGRAPGPPRRGLSTPATLALTLAAVLFAVGGTLGVQNFLSGPELPAPPDVTSPDVTNPVSQTGTADPSPPTPEPPVTPQPVAPTPADAPDEADEPPDEELEPELSTPSRPVRRATPRHTATPSKRNQRTQRTPRPPPPERPQVPEEREEVVRGIGELRVTVAPWGNISVDGRPRGRAPQTLNLTVGAHTVTARTDGQPPRTRRVTVRAGARSHVHFAAP